MSKILENLNPAQKEAVDTTEGAVLVIAGAGSGKTRTLTHRIAYLIKEKNVDPRNILAVTFTNKAAKEMKERTLDLLRGLDDSFSLRDVPLVGTFHSICALILRREIDKIGYERSFNIFDDQDQLTLIKGIFKEKGIDKNQFNPRSILGTISKAKNELLSVEEFLDKADGFYEEVVADIYSSYQRELKNSNALDFDDLIRLTIKVFRADNEVLERYQSMFRYVMVDEYQDTNYAQYILIKLLAQKYGNIWVCGDDWQSIYGWRQADIRNILEFEKDYKNTKIIKLEQNYRSTQVILDAAYGVISKNVNKKDKEIWTEEKDGSLIGCYEASDEIEEGNFIATKIKEAVEDDKHSQYANFAVLYRTNAQSRTIEETFLKNDIPYRIVGGIKFYQRKEIKDIVAYLRLIQNNTDKVALERVVNEPKRGIGKKTLEKWMNFAREFEGNLIDSGKDSNLKSVINKGKYETIHSFCTFITDVKSGSDSLTLRKFIEKVFVKSGYEKYLHSLGEEGEVKIENIKELLSVAKKYDEKSLNEALDLFLEEVALVADTDKINQSEDVVHLMTLHSAKGLEFDTVFIVGLEEGIFPHSRSMLAESEMEEERRLMYVGITRAEKKVFLVFASLRTIFGSVQANSPSRFIDEVPSKLIESISNTGSDYLNKRRQDVDFSERNSVFNDGDKVRHEEFGEGMIISVIGDSISVAFPEVGIKKFSKKYAPLNKV